MELRMTFLAGIVVNSYSNCRIDSSSNSRSGANSESARSERESRYEMNASGPHSQRGKINMRMSNSYAGSHPSIQEIMRIIEHSRTKSSRYVRPYGIGRRWTNLVKRSIKLGV
jgi:hypothetical protein